MAPNATPPKPTLRSKLHLRPSTSLKVSKAAVFTLLALISVQTVSSALLWYAGKIKADSSSRVVTTSPASSVTTTGATLSGTYDYPTDVTQRGFQYGLTTGYGSQVVDDSVMTYVDTGILGGVDTSSGSSGYATDSTGNLYLTHFDDHTSASVQKYSASGTLVSEFGSQGAGDGQFDTPQDVALDTSGNIYVADTNNNRVQKLDSTGNYVSQFDPLEQGSGKYIVVTRVSLDSLGNIYVFGHWDSDPGISNNWQPVVQRYNASGVFQTQLINSSGTATNQLYSYAQNTDLTTDTSNNLYITDAYNHRVLKYDSSGNFLAQWGTTGVASNAPGQFNLPTGIARGPGGQLYISDGGNDRVQIISPAGDYVQSWSDNQIGFPLNLTVSLNGKIYAQSWGGAGGLVVGTPSINANITSLQCDTTYHYRAFTTDADSTEYGADATFTTDACTGLRNITNLPTTNISQTGATLHAATDYPQGITDSGFQYGLTASYGSSVTGGVDSGSYINTGVLSGVERYPGSLATDLSGNIYAAYFNGEASAAVRKYSPDGNLLLEIGSFGTGDGQFETPLDVHVDSSNNIFIVSDHRVQKFSSAGAFISSFNVAEDDSGTLAGVSSVSVDSSGSIYVSGTWGGDFNSSYPLVQKYSSSGILTGQFINQVGSGTNQLAQASTLDLANDASGNLYIVDTYNHRVLKLNSSGDFVAQLGTTSVPSSVQGQFNKPTGVSVSTNGLVYILEAGQDGIRGRIQAFNAGGSVVRERLDGPVQNGSMGRYIAVTPGGGIYTDYYLVDIAGTWIAKILPVDVGAPITSLTCSTTYHYRAYVTDRGGTQYGSDATFTTSACPPLDITTTTLDDGVVGVGYSDLITVNNLQGGETYGISSGSLPPGLSIDSGTGYITGTPGQSGTFNFDVTVENAGSSDTAFLTITVAEFANPLSITTSSLPDAEVDTYYQQYIYTSDSVSNVDFSVISGAIPDGMTLYSDSVNGILYGSPTTVGTYTFTVQAQDSRGAGAGTDTQEYTISVTPPGINITTTTLGPGRVGVSYDRSIEYELASATPVFSLASGNLPPGVSLTIQGYLQGTPTEAGTYSFTVRADDGFSTDTQALTLTVLPALSDIDNSPLVTITSPSNNADFPGGASTITGTGPANQTISIFIDGTQVGTTVASAQGTWTYQTSGIAVGSHTLDAKWVPGAEIMFIPVMDIATLQTVVNVYDTLSDTLVKQIALPEYSYGTNVVVSSSAILVFGVDMSGGGAKVWFINLNSADVISTPTDDLISSSVFSADGGRLYSTALSGWFIATNMATFEVQTVDLWPNNERNYSSIQLSDDGSKAYVGTMQDVVGPFNPTDLPLEQRARLGVLYEVNTLQGTLISTINTVDNADLAELEYSTGLAVVGNTAYVPVVRRTATDTPGTTAESYIKLYNISTGQFIRQISVSTLSANGTVLPQGGYADIANNAIYFHGRSILEGAADSIVKLDLLTDAVTITPFTASEGTTTAAAWGIDSGGNGSKLYTTNNLVSQGLRQAYVQAMNLTTGNLLSTSGYPISVGNNSSIAAQIGSSFSAIITPPQDSIAFTVTATPVDCKVAGTCPVDCKVTGTCPTDCAVTNSCPVNPPTVNPPVPTTVGTTGTQYPKIVTTPFPPATPTVSRLGWFDRGVLAVARFVPRQAAIGFPFLLFLLLLLFALSLYYQSANEVRKDKLNRQFLAKRKSIRAQQDNFIALASHYLNTPITIIQNGIEVMEESSRGPKSK